VVVMHRALGFVGRQRGVVRPNAVAVGVGHDPRL
jgi:hypothetical protein